MSSAAGEEVVFFTHAESAVFCETGKHPAGCAAVLREADAIRAGRCQAILRVP